MNEQLEYEVKRLMSLYGTEEVYEMIAVLLAKQDEQMATGEDNEN